MVHDTVLWNQLSLAQCHEWKEAVGGGCDGLGKLGSTAIRKVIPSYRGNQTARRNTIYI